MQGTQPIATVHTAIRNLILASSRRSRLSLQTGRQQARRWNTTNTNGGDIRGGHQEKPFWTTGRVALLTAFASSLTYVYGISDAKTNFEKVWHEQKTSTPKYGSVKDLDKVHTLSTRRDCSIYPC